MKIPRFICLLLEMEDVFFAASFACAKTGKRIAARIAMIAITTKSSMSVNAFFIALEFQLFFIASAHPVQLATSKIDRSVRGNGGLESLTEC